MSTERAPDAPALLVRFLRLIDAIEAAPIGPGRALLALAAVISLRNVLELIVATNPAFNALAAFVHYPLAYLGPFASLTLVLAAWSGRPPARVARLMLAAWMLTLVPPLADALLGIHHETPTIGYLKAAPADLPRVVVRFFDPTATFDGTTAGIRIETLAAVLLAAVYVLLRRRGALRALGAAASVYVVSLFWFTLPTLVLFAVRLPLPGAGENDLLRGEGAVARPVPDVSADATAVCWLVLVLLGVAALWSAVERRHARGDRWFEPAGPPRFAGLAAFGALAVFSGSATARLLRFPADAVIARAPFDLLAPLAGVAVLAALLAALAALGRNEPHRAGALALLGLAGLTALGTPVAMGLAVAGTALAPAATLPLRGPGRLAARVLGGGLAAFGAFLAGAALVAGGETFARLPIGLPAAWLVAGLLAGTAGLAERPGWLAPVLWGAAGLAPPILLGAPVLLLVAVPAGLLVGLLAAAGRLPSCARFGGHRWGGLVSGAAVALLVTAALSRDAIREPLVERFRCVARIEAIRGEEFSRKGRYDSARTRFRQALECDPDYAMAWRSIGLTFLAEDNPPRAVKALEKAAALAPDAALIAANLASAYLEAGRYEDAVRAAERALALDPRELSALWNRAQAFELLGDRQAAIEAWRDYLALAPGRAEPAEVASARRHLRALRRGEVRSAPR